MSREGGKNRVVLNNRPNNIFEPISSVKLPAPETILNSFPKNGVSIVFDIASAFDQVPKNINRMNDYCVQSKNPQTLEIERFVVTGASQGDKKSPQLNCFWFLGLLSILFELPFILYIDDLSILLGLKSWPVDNLKKMRNFVILIFTLFGIKLSIKTDFNITDTPSYLGKCILIPQQVIVPQMKQVYKLCTLILRALTDGETNTVANLLAIKGLSNFCLNRPGVLAGHEIDQWLGNTVSNFHISTIQQFKKFLHTQIGLSKKTLRFFRTLLKLLLETYTLNDNPPCFIPLQNVLYIITDASDDYGGGFCLLNGSYVALDNQLINFDSFPLPQISDNWTEWGILPSSTWRERITLLHYLQIHFKFLQSFILKFSITHIVILTDSLPLTLQIRNLLNTSAETNHQIKTIYSLLSQLRVPWSIFWHPRDTLSAIIADSTTRQPEILLHPSLFDCLQKSSFVYQIEQKFWQRVSLISPPWEIPQFDPHKLQIIFPLPYLSYKRFRLIWLFLQTRSMKGILLVPRLRKLRTITKNSILNYPFKHPYFGGRSHIPKNFSIDFVPFDFT